MKIPFFSVVIPLYNKEPHIQRAINSVLNQSFSDYEIIVINDASTDNSLQKLKEIESDKIRIYHRKEPGPGGYAARNLGIEKSAAKYIAFLDADDEWLPKHLEDMYQLIYNFPKAGMYSCGYRLKNGNIIKTNTYYNKNKNRDSHVIQNYFKEVPRGRNPMCCSVAVIEKTKIIEAGMFPHGKCRRRGDSETWMRMALKNQIAWTPNLGAIYYKDSVNSVTKMVSDIDIPYVYHSVKEILPTLDEERKRELKRYSNRFSNMCIFHSIVFGVRVEEVMKGYYKEVDPGPYLFFRILKLFPSSILIPLFRGYRYMMVKISREQV